MHVQQGLEGPPDLPSSDPFPPVDEADTQTYTLAYTESQGIRSHQPTHIYFLLCLMVERAGGLVSVMCFPQGAFGCHSEAVLFSVTLHVAAPSPQAAFSICKSDLLFVLWFCRQCSSILFPAPFHL